ncbi:MAG: hypothetical protein IPI39_18445 [Candidatus Obscuribacter sp.]|nr:hypothetical protein [Candidatus Obscuribacter sp.]
MTEVSLAIDYLLYRALQQAIMPPISFCICLTALLPQLFKRLLKLFIKPQIVAQQTFMLWLPHWYLLVCPTHSEAVAWILSRSKSDLDSLLSGGTLLF